MKNTGSRFLVISASVVLAVTGLPASAHVEDNFNAIHFNSGRPDFGTPPRRAILNYRGEEDDRPVKNWGLNTPDYRSHVELTEQNDTWREVKLQRQRAEWSAKAAVAMRNGKWPAAIAAYEQMGQQLGWSGGVRNRIRVLQTAVHRGEAAKYSADIQEFERAMDSLDTDQSKSAAAQLQTLLSRTQSSWLKSHALYQSAGIAYSKRNFPEAQQGFRAVLAGWTDRELREDCLIMVARADLQSGRSAERQIPSARWAISKLETNYPKTRFHSDIEGLKVRMAVLSGDYAGAIRIYIRRGDFDSVEWVLKRHPDVNHGDFRPQLLAGRFLSLGQAASFQDYDDAVTAVSRCRKSFSVADAAAFSRILETMPDVAASYLYYRLYLCDATPLDYKRLAALADRTWRKWIVNSSNNPDLLALTYTRLSEVSYQNHDYSRANSWALRSLAAKTSDRAMFVSGACRLRSGDNAQSIQIFNRLLTRFPTSPLRRSVREELALAYERHGDLSAALDEYVSLGYKADIAFMLDGRMTIDQVRRYVEAHPRHQLQSVLDYTMGVRCLRGELYHEANAWFARVPKQDYQKYIKYSDDWLDDPSVDGMTAAANLQRLRNAVGKSHGEARAKAEYRYASYIYKGGTLLFYNSALWDGSRATGFSYWWNPDVASRSDIHLARKHMYEHDVYARSMRLCLSIARRYPHSSVAPEALYRAACSARLLADFNGWWRGEAFQAGLWNTSVHLMKQVAAKYPKSPLATHARKYAGVFENEAADHMEYRDKEFDKEWAEPRSVSGVRG